MFKQLLIDCTSNKIFFNKKFIEEFITKEKCDGFKMSGVKFMFQLPRTFKGRTP